MEHYLCHKHGVYTPQCPTCVADAKEQQPTLGSVLMVGSRWRHYKGHEVMVLGLVRHTETEERLVLYWEGTEFIPWARPLAEWNEVVTREGYTGPRFVKLED